MKDYELLDMLGEVNEDYVLAADGNVVRPRFRWKAFALCAACTALVVCAYPAYKMINNKPAASMGMLDNTCDAAAPEAAADLARHSFILAEEGGEGGGIMATAGDVKSAPELAPAPAAPAGGAEDAVVSGLSGSACDEQSGDADTNAGFDGAHFETARDAPAQEEAAAQYDNLLQGMGVPEMAQAGSYPEWYAGAWLDNDWPDAARLTVAIVDGFRTPELEAQILEWCGGTGEVLFRDAQYSLNHLDSLMEPVVEAVNDGIGLSSAIGVDVVNNCLGVDIYGDEAVLDEVLIRLAELDPSDTAVRVRLFPGGITLTDEELVKAPAPNANAPADIGAVPGGANGSAAVISLAPGTRENTQPAQPEELPETK